MADYARWIKEEDSFVLSQRYSRSLIKVAEKRPEPIDLCAVLFSDLEAEVETPSPLKILINASLEDLTVLDEEIKSFVAAEIGEKKTYWRSLGLLVSHAIKRKDERAIKAVEGDIKKLLKGKTLNELLNLQVEVENKLQETSIEPEYWDQLLHSVKVQIATRRVAEVYNKANLLRKERLRQRQFEEARIIRERLRRLQKETDAATNLTIESAAAKSDPIGSSALEKSSPEILPVVAEDELLKRIKSARAETQKAGYIPMALDEADPNTKNTLGRHRQRQGQRQGQGLDDVNSKEDDAKIQRFAVAAEKLHRPGADLEEDENEEAFYQEERLPPKAYEWAELYTPRKPRYICHVKRGYEWNKYNQTHYDKAHPPPMVAQGYKFNIFYPDLVDPSKTPRYRLIRSSKRKRGIIASDDETCVIVFEAGAPYSDLAFRIVDKDWDYSSKRGRGFKSSFDRNCLQLHFRFKRVFYRK